MSLQELPVGYGCRHLRAVNDREEHLDRDMKTRKSRSDIRSWLLLIAVAVIGFAATGCGATIGKLALNQDPNVRWVQSPVGQVDATQLATQRLAAKPATSSWENEARCAEADFKARTNDVVKAHNAFVKTTRESVQSNWLTDAIGTEGMIASVVAQQIDIGANVKAFTPAPWQVGAQFESEQTGLVIARVAHKAVLTDAAVTCVTSGMCREHKKGDRIQYVRGVYYGNLIRLELTKKAFSLDGTATVSSSVNSSFALKASDMTLSGSIIGLLDSDKSRFDVPFILEHLGETKLVTVQGEFAKAARSFGVIAIEFGDGPCE